MPLIPQPSSSALMWMGIVGCAAMFIMAINVYPDLPERIPSHFDASGNPNGWSHKIIIYAFPAFSALLFATMFWLSDKPQWYNYPVAITPSNQDAWHRWGKTMVSNLSVGLTWAFALLEYGMIEAAMHPDSGLPIWIMPLVLLGIFVPIIQAWRHQPRSS